MERRDLLKIGISAPLVLLPSIAQPQDGGMDVIRRNMQLVWSNESDGGEDEKITYFFINYKTKFYVANLSKFDLSDDEDAGGKQTATDALRGSRRIGRIHAYYQDGIKGSFLSGIYVTPKTIPKVRTAPVLIQAFYDGKPYTLSGSIKLRPLGARKSKKLPQLSEFRQKPIVANLYQNQNTLIISPKNVRLGFRLTF